MHLYTRVLEFPHLGSGWTSGSLAPQPPPTGVSSFYGSAVQKHPSLPVHQQQQYKLPYAHQQFSSAVFQNKQYGKK
jgi:hypothetical protein